MGEKKKKIYHALVDGAMTGLTDKALFDFVIDKCPKTSSKGVVRASLLALSDPDLRDRNVLNAIYALAIKHRLDPGADDDHDEDDASPAPLISTKDDAPKKKKPAGKAKKAVTAEDGAQA